MVCGIELLTTGYQYNECNDEEYKAPDDVHRPHVEKNFKNYASYDQSCGGREDGEGRRERGREEEMERERRERGLKTTKLSSILYRPSSESVTNGILQQCSQEIDSCQKPWHASTCSQ